MSRYGVSPNMMIMPPQMLLYMALAPEAKLSAPPFLKPKPCSHSSHHPSTHRLLHCRCAAYEKGGPAAEARFEAGVAGFEARAFRGCGIMTSEPFEVSEDQDSVQMLTRNSQVGEFYVLQPPQVKPEAGKEKFTCDALIYDEESDRHVRVTWEQALKACCIGGDGVSDDTKMASPTKGMKNQGNNDATGKPNPAKDDLSEWKDRASAWIAFNNGDQVTWGDLDPDIRIVIARPFIEHLMHSVVMTVSGRDTGATLFGPADMQLSANTQVKTIEGACPLTHATLPCTHGLPASR